MGNVSVAVVDSEFGDWSGIYVNGELEVEGHSISNSDWMNLINKYKSFEKAESFVVDGDYIEGMGSLPVKFEDLEYLI